MGRNLGLNPGSVRSQAGLVRSQLGSLEHIAQELRATRTAGRYPSSYGIQPGQQAMDPASQGTAASAISEIEGAVASARSLLARLEGEISQQEIASGASSSRPGGTTVPVPDDSGNGTDPKTTTVTIAPVITPKPDSEVKWSDNHFDSPSDYDDLVKPLREDPNVPPKDESSVTAKVEMEVKVGAEAKVTTVEEDGRGVRTTTDSVFLGGTFTGELETEVTDDSVTLTSEVGVKTGVTATHSETYQEEGYSSKTETEASATVGWTASHSTEYGEDGVKETASIGVEAEASVSASGEFENEGGLSGEGELSASASAKAEATASAEYKDDGTAVYTVKAEVGATVTASAEGSLEYGIASVGGEVTATATASAQATATATIGPEGASLAVGASAMAVASASASANVEMMGVKGEVTGEVYAGIGVKAEAELSVTAEKVSLSLDLGVALGVGAGVSFDISFSPQEMWNDLTSMFW